MLQAGPMKLGPAFRFAAALLAAVSLAACSSADSAEETVESDEAALTSTARAFVGDYRWQDGTDYLDYTQLNLKNSRRSWGRYEAMADVGLTGSLIVCKRAPCTSEESGDWKITKYRGKYTLRLRPDAGGERVYALSRSGNSTIKIARNGSSGLLSIYEDPCNLVDCQPGMTCRDDFGVATCEPLDPCMTVRCAAGTQCVATPQGTASCEPVTNPCAAMLCGPGTTCVVDANNEGSCQPIATEPCVKTGCSGQICSDQHRVTTCQFLAEYACYQTAICERNAAGQCGWRPTPELTTCLATN